MSLLGHSTRFLRHVGCGGPYIALLVACSVNQHGTSRVDRWATDDLVGYHLTALGGHLDTRDKSTSFTLGHFETVHVFPAACDDIPNVAALTTPDLFHIVRPQASITRSLGVQLVAGSGEAGLTIGFRENARLLSFDSSSSFRRSFYFDATDYQKSQMSFFGNCRLEKRRG